MSEKIRWGVLGCAAIAKVRTIPGLLASSNAQLYAVASRGTEKAQAFKEAFGAEKAYGSYEQLLADEMVQAVYIPLPNSMHCEWVKKAADAGKHILCEKPMALDAKEAAEMFDYCREKGVYLMEAFAYRQAPLVQKVKEILDAGTIGKIKYLEAHLTDLLEDMGNIRMQQNLGGGALYDMACYDISVISYLIGAEPVKAKALAKMDPERGVDTAAVFALEYADGTLATAYASLDSYARGYYCVVGEKGRIEVPCNFNCRNEARFSVKTGGHTDNVEVLDEVETVYSVMCPQNYMLEIEQFGRVITGQEEPLVSREETLRNAAILDMVFADLRK